MSFRGFSGIRLLMIAGCAVFVLLGLSVKTSAVELGPDWLHSTLAFEVGSDYSYQDGDQYTYLANIPGEWVSAKFDGVDMRNHAVPLSSGYLADGYFWQLGTQQWQKVMLQGIYDRAYFYGVPNTSGVFVMTSSDGMYCQANGPCSLHFVPNFEQMYGKISASGGKIYRWLSTDFNLEDTAMLKRPDNGIVTVGSGFNLSVSANGKWAYAQTSEGQVRMQLPDLSYKQITTQTAYSRYASLSAVSNSGRFVVSGSVTGRLDKPLLLYDTNDCSQDLSVGCKSLNLYDFVLGEYSKTLDGGLSVNDLYFRGVKFNSEAKLEVYAEARLSDGSVKTFKAYVSVDPGPQTIRYLALGDSFSSGEGALSYRDGTDFYVNDSNFSFCHQSTISYPYLLSKSLMPDWFGDVACSGAETKDIISQNEELYNTKLRQAYGLESSVYNNRISEGILPGYRTQLSFISTYHPTTATISIGGNDIGFGNIVTQCVTQKYTGGGNCYSQGISRDWLASTIDQKIPLLTSTFLTLKNNLSGDQILYVIGYPQVVNPAAPNTICDLNVQMTFEERKFASDLIDYLNEAVKIASSNAGVKYIDVSSAFFDADKDYRLCGNQPVSAVNGLIASFPYDNYVKYVLNKKPSDLAYHESYHPNSIGHILLARKIKIMTNDFSAAMLELPTKQTNKVGDVFRSQFVGYTTSAFDNSLNLKEDLIDGIVQPGASFSLNIDTGSSLPPSPGTEATVEIHSTPTILEKVSLDSSGITKTTITIPASISTGPHELHIYYTDIAGKQVDMYQYIYVVHSLLDYDGNGIPNSQEKCLIVPASGVDVDMDGIDDACDGEYVSLPEDTARSAESEVAALLGRAVTTGTISSEEAEFVVKSDSSVRANDTTANQTVSTYHQVSGQDTAVSRNKFQNIFYLIIGALTLLFCMGVIYFYKHHKHNKINKG